MKQILCCPADNEGSGFYRVTEPYSSLQVDGFNFKTIREVISSDEVDNCDALLIQRPIDPGLLNMCYKAKEQGKKVIIEVDDLISAIGPTNDTWKYWREHSKNYNSFLRMCDYIHCSTNELRKELGYPEKTFVFQNSIKEVKVDQTAYYRNKLRSQYGIPFDKKVIMWGGSTSHRDTLDLLKPIVKHYAGTDVVFVIASNKDWLAQYGITESNNVKVIGWLPLEEYTNLPAMADVFLTPLLDTKFNASKSPLKVIEAAAWGIPSVSSAISPYVEFNLSSQGGNLLVKKNRFGDWISQINRLLDDDNLYRETQEKAINAVNTTYSLTEVNRQRGEWWKCLNF